MNFGEQYEFLAINMQASSPLPFCTHRTKLPILPLQDLENLSTTLTASAVVSTGSSFIPRNARYDNLLDVAYDDIKNSGTKIKKSTDLETMLRQYKKSPKEQKASGGS